MDAAVAYLMATLTGSNAPVSPSFSYSTATTLVNSSTDALVNNLTAAVTAGVTYGILAEVCYTTGTSSAGTPVFTFHGPSASPAILLTDFLDSNAGTVTAARVLNGSIGSAATGPTMTASNTCAYRASGLATFSATGSISLQAHTTIGADTFTCQVMSFLAVTPLPAA